MAGSTVIPCFRCADAQNMIAWLVAVLGFEKRAVHDDGEGGVAHAQLTLGEGMVMLGSRRADALGDLRSAPYVVVADPDAIHDRATLAGAEIVMPIRDEDYGGRGFACRDPEGNVWSVGSYDPWKAA